MTLPIYQEHVTNDSGDIQPLATFRVKLESTGLDAVIYSDRAGTTQKTGGPNYPTDDGLISFFAPAGEYIIEATSAAGAYIRRFEVLPGTAATLDTGTDSNQIPTNADLYVDSIADLPPVVVGQQIRTAGYQAGSTVGGLNPAVGVASAVHDGVIYFDPNRSSEIGTAAYYVPGAAAPCWVRILGGGEFLSSFAGDLTADSIRAFASSGIAAGYKHLKISPGSYAIEADGTDPGTGEINSNVLLLSGESDVVIDMYGAVINQSTTNATGGFIQFHNCQSCGVVGGKMQGVYNVGTGQTTNSLCIISGSSNLCYSKGGEVDGGRALVTLRSSDGTTTGDKPTGSIVVGKFKNTEYAINYTHCGYGHRVDLVGSNVLRVAYITGTSGITGSLVCRGSKGAALNISTRGGAEIKDIKIDVEFDECNVPLRLRVEDAIAATLQNIKITGSVTASVNAPADGVVIQGSSVASVYDNIDLSDLSVSVVGGNSGVLITGGNASQTISNIILPKYANSETQYALEIDNTALATIKNISSPPGAVYRYSGTDSSHAVDCQKGLVQNLDLSGAVIDASTSSGSFAAFIYEIDGLKLNDVLAPGGKEIIARTNTNYVTAKRMTHLNFSHGEKTDVSGSFTAFGLDTAYLSGTGNITQFKRCYKGQKIKLISIGSTQTVIHSASIILAGGVDFTFTNNDVIELECITAGESSIFLETNRSVNG